ncbi:type II toxin-antitoxin system RelE/ParE family toxin [Klebsiella pneumoniae]|uniref:type II toxin-antitoxin system RelE/ParE family toxin n=1 Tax=Klebsiella pneumoniae TaxID=573 RepID=UPI00210A9781|nr:type II toxin-antitoxin system RelE/ParE family toxin [Klebsiella pneumoniae]
MFTVIFHDEAEKEFTALPAAIRAKMARLLMKLEANPRQLREPDTKPLGNGLFEIRTMGADIARGIWYIRVVNVFFYFGSLSKNRQKRPRQK